jgi:uncharacterized membrane protein
MRNLLLGSLLTAAVLGSVAACGDDEPAESQIDCETSTATYANAVVPVAEKCVLCHSASKTNLDRIGAPEGVNYDTEADWLANGAHGLIMIQDGSMPPEGVPGPSADEVAKLDEWVTCQGLKEEHAHDHEH